MHRLGHARRENRAVAAECDERVIARVAAALARHGFERPAHVGGGDQMRAICRLLDAHAERPRDPIGDNGARLRGGELQRAADEPSTMPAPTWYSVARVSSPFSINEAFAVVPPMSNEIALSMPTRRVNACTPTTPAAGPDSMMCIGVTAAALAVVSPPFDCIKRSEIGRAHV